MHLGDRSGADGLFVEPGEEIFEGRAKGLLNR
jgi:hypothetical protein